MFEIVSFRLPIYMYSSDFFDLKPTRHKLPLSVRYINRVYCKRANLKRHCTNKRQCTIYCDKNKLKNLLIVRLQDNKLTGLRIYGTCSYLKYVMDAAPHCVNH